VFCTDNFSAKEKE